MTYLHINQGFRGFCPQLDAFCAGYTKCASSRGHREKSIKEIFRVQKAWKYVSGFF